jgi:hypothetical protein
MIMTTSFSLSNVNGLCLQCPDNHEGDPVTLQKFDSTSELQQWNLVFQKAADGFGFAFVNTLMNLSISLPKGGEPLAATPFEPGSGTSDVWGITVEPGDSITISYPSNGNLIWDASLAPIGSTVFVKDKLIVATRVWFPVSASAALGVLSQERKAS